MLWVRKNPPKPKSQKELLCCLSTKTKTEDDYRSALGTRKQSETAIPFHFSITLPCALKYAPAGFYASGLSFQARFSFPLSHSLSLFHIQLFSFLFQYIFCLIFIFEIVSVCVHVMLFYSVILLQLLRFFISFHSRKQLTITLCGLRYGMFESCSIPYCREMACFRMHFYLSFFDGF